MPLHDREFGEGADGDINRPSTTFYPEEAVKTVTRLSKNVRGRDVVWLMCATQHELERRFAILSPHSPEFSIYQTAVETVSLLVTERIGRDAESPVVRSTLEK
jgi:hypothetical protein